MSPRYYLLVVGDRKPLAWILSQQRTAFTSRRSSIAIQLKVGDHIMIYTTRGCFRNPTRDRGRLIAEARVASNIVELEKPVEFGGKSFTKGCGLKIDHISPLGQGPILADFVDQLDTFPSAWATHIRRSLVPLNKKDFTILKKALDPTTVTRHQALQAYMGQASSI